MSIAVGDKLIYQPKHYGSSHYDKCRVAKIIDSERVSIVTICGGDWENYLNYSSQIVAISDLKSGW
jgi:hypothetical protein